jgi:two-component system CheB/CheR fusion protein
MRPDATTGEPRRGDDDRGRGPDAALRASEARLRNLIERDADGVVVVCHQGTICFVNSAAEALLGRTAGALCGRSFGIPIVHGGTTEIDVSRPGGQVRIAEMRVVETEWEGKPALLASLRDITERKRAEEAMRASEERFRMISEVTTDFTYSLVVLPDGTLVIDWLTEAFPRITGYAGLEVQARGWTSLVHADDRAAVETHLARVLAGEAGICEHRILTKAGEVRWLRDHARPLRDPSTGRTVRVYGAGQDVTERRRLEEELRRRVEELAEADRQKNEFLAMLAHELRNPLAPVLNAVHIMRRMGHDGPMLERTREMIEVQVKHMVRLVDDLLDVSRITRGKIELRKEALDLAAVVARAVEATRPLAERRGVELIVDLTGEPLPLEADPTRQEQVLTNLLNNAAKYTDSGGHVRLSAAREGGEVVIRVRDDGIGIDAEMLPRVFDPFAQADGSLDRSQGGLGIGLTLVRKLTEMHGGSVSASSEGLGRGSEFVVRLPAPRRGETSSEADGPQRAAEEKSRLRILVVDDNLHSAESLAVLVKLWGHEARVAHDGPEAIEVALEFRPHVMLLDIGLPRLDGYKVARRLRQEPGLDDLLLIAMTGYGQDEDRRRSREAGFDHHLVKPVDLTRLEAMLAGTGLAARRVASGP